jgi:hypothetical protein
MRVSIHLQNLTLCCPSINIDDNCKQEILGRTNRLLSVHYIPSTVFDTARVAQKTPRPTVLQLLRVYFLQQERVYRAVA